MNQVRYLLFIKNILIDWFIDWLIGWIYLFIDLNEINQDDENNIE